MGLLSDGGVHSHITHIFAILDMAKQRGLETVYVHCYLDGRDVNPTSGAGFVEELQNKCAELGNVKIATIQGRFWGMDRDKRWERVQKGYDAIVRARGVAASDPVQAVKDSYANEKTDEFMEPTVICPEGHIKSGDSVIFMNFRPDRAREMTWALTGNLPEGSTLDTDELSLSYVCTAQYDAALTLPIAFPPEHLEGTIGEYVSSLGYKQFRVAETEKYAHVTFFLNGGVEKQYEGEERVLVPSPKEFATYDLVPEMSAVKVKDELVKRMDQGGLRHVCLQLCQLRHGGPHRRHPRRRQGGGDRGRVPGRCGEGRKAQRHHPGGHRGPRQRRQDGRAQRQPQHRPTPPTPCPLVLVGTGELKLAPAAAWPISPPPCWSSWAWASRRR